MKLTEFNRLIENPESRETKIKTYLDKKAIRLQEPDENEIKGHFEKAEHDLSFISDNFKLGYFDWCITGCYYAMYHAATALLLTKGYHSKNHDATICLLIKEYYPRIPKEDIALINKFYLDYQELLFYIQAKNKREEATYSSKYKFNKKTVEELKLKAILFINKAKEMIL